LGGNIKDEKFHELFVNEPVISITEAHPARVYWATPRRIIVDLDSNSDDECACGVCGRHTNDYVTNFYMETYGEKYDLTWRHPLSPYYKRKGKKGIEMLPLHLNKDGVTYSNYPIYAFSDTDVGRNALAVNNYRDNKPKYWSHRDDKHRDDKIMIFGYDAQKTTVNGWYEGKMILSVADKNIRDIYESIVLLLVDVAKYIVSRMKARVARAIDGVPTEIGYLFWKYTEEKFDEILKLLNTELINKFTVYGKNLKNTHVDDVKLMWLSHLSTVALKLYDEFADITTNSSENRMKRIVENRKFLAIEISKGNKEISKLLNLPESDKNGGKHKQKRK
jgi:CRISPR system Cascade subunit CasA